VQAALIRFRVQGHGLDAQFLAGAHDAQCDLARLATTSLRIMPASLARESPIPRAKGISHLAKPCPAGIDRAGLAQTPADASQRELPGIALLDRDSMASLDSIPTSST